MQVNFTLHIVHNNNANQVTQNSIARHQSPKNPYILARFEPTISCSVGGDDDH
jgi:hypothetical protein